ncbi:hypothetical protein PENCOP_c006G07956 [Penicillium coprophilum]|uniref:Uncharacterized protein n=1 Tax=Penicillium coprophilum TaxID=36646 RepID=A0A1V6UN72_9EURO|nr:hypothetical protein PENCOP_c006G07956 [Penicillium coprophilum]
MIPLNNLAVLQFIGFGWFHMKKTLLILTYYTPTSNESKFCLGCWLHYLSYPAAFRVNTRDFLTIITVASSLASAEVSLGVHLLSVAALSCYPARLLYP